MTEDRTSRQRVGWAVALLAGGALAGGAIAMTLPASADTSPSPSTSSGTTAAAPDVDRGHGGQRAGETLLTGTNLAKAKAAALKAVPGATVDRVETDADGAVYEAHLTKADGTRVTVKFDKDFGVTAVQDGMGAGGPGAPGTAQTGGSA